LLCWLVYEGDLAPAYLDGQGAVKPQAASPVPEGQPSAGSPRVKVVYYNHLVCMSPYLFFLGVGTYSTYRRRVGPLLFILASLAGFVRQL
jgi:hypothetical protein